MNDLHASGNVTAPPGVDSPRTNLFIWFPPGDAVEESLKNLFEEIGCPHQPHEEEGCLKVGPLRDDLTRAITVLGERLSASETLSVKALILPEKRNPSMKDMPNIMPLRALISQYQVRWLSEVMRFSSHYQPIVHANDTSRIYGYEALLRAFDRDGNPVPPMRLFSCAKDTKTLGLLDQGARTAAIETLEGRSIAGSLFINCSPSSLEDSDAFLSSMLRLLSQHGLMASRVVLEIVELEQVTSIPEFKRHLECYRQKGFRIALDDVGSGYSSLNLIHHMRPDFVKIDMDLVRGVHQDVYKATVTSNLLSLTQQLGIQTIAEGVEDLAELIWLRSHGADFVQGYLIAKPQFPPPVNTPAIKAPAARREKPAEAAASVWDRLH